MSHSSVPFRAATPKEIASRISLALAELAPGAVVRVGAEHRGVRNVAIDIPIRPRSITPGVYMRLVGRALEAAGVVCAPDALAPAVHGRVRAMVRTADPPAPGSVAYADSAHIGRGPGG
jgi:hypothetical protein